MDSNHELDRILKFRKLLIHKVAENVKSAKNGVLRCTKILFDEKPPVFC